MDDSALAFFRRDQKTSGLSVREYERTHGIFLSNPGTEKPYGLLADIRSHEAHLSERAATIGHEAHCRACANGIRNRRQGTSLIGQDAPISTTRLAEAARQ